MRSSICFPILKLGFEEEKQQRMCVSALCDFDQNALCSKVLSATLIRGRWAVVFHSLPLKLFNNHLPHITCSSSSLLLFCLKFFFFYFSNVFQSWFFLFSFPSEYTWCIYTPQKRVRVRERWKMIFIYFNWLSRKQKIRIKVWLINPQAICLFIT